MADGLRRELRRRWRDPLVHASFWPGLVAAATWVVLTIRDDASTGAALWFPAVIVPTVAGVLWIVAGARWVLRGSGTRVSVRCERCGYDLRHQQGHGAACPECGSPGTRTTLPAASIRVLGQLPGVALLLAGLFGVGLAAFFAILIDAGVFDV